ncbi:MAG: hypothetical protein QOH95_1032 [Gaiellaceae bacterium]|nr:hypothetical protein [Gaiellaceae bacterium]
MHRHLVRVAARPAHVDTQRPAKVVALEARRQARLQRAQLKPLPPRAA